MSSKSGVSLKSNHHLSGLACSTPYITLSLSHKTHTYWHDFPPTTMHSGNCETPFHFQVRVPLISFSLGRNTTSLHGCRNHSNILSLPNAYSLCRIRAKGNICPPVYVGWVCPSRLVTYRGCRPWIKSHTGHFGFPKEYHFRPKFLVPTEHPNDKSHHVRHRVTSSCYVESTYSIAIVQPYCKNWEVICFKCKLPRVITTINSHVS